MFCIVLEIFLLLAAVVVNSRGYCVNALILYTHEVQVEGTKCF